MKLKLLHCFLIALAFGFSNAQTQSEEDFISNQKPFKIGDEIDVKLKTTHPYQSLKAGVVFEKEFYSKNSTYIKLYFRNFDLAPGDYVEIYSPENKESIVYAGKGKIVDNGVTTISDFWSQVIFTDKVVVKLHAVQPSKGYGFDLDTVAYGYSPERIVELQEEQNRAICSGDDKERIACYNGTEMFNKAKAVCKLILNGSGSCTGWLLGCEGNIMTNNHCIGNATTARNTDFLFNFQANSCSGGTNATTDQVASSATFIKTNGSVDATIVKLPVNPTNKYGYLSLRSTSARAGERIYIPQHPGGRRKEIAVESGNTVATIQSINGSRDLQYLADTEGGSSGSPVLDFNTNLVLGIHNTGGCPNGARGGNARLISWLGSDLPRCGINDDNNGGGNDDPPADGDCTGIVSSFPYNESFEGNSAWRQSGADDLNWTINSNGTPSNGTGPSGAVNGNSYAYLEVSGNGQGFPNKRGIINSPCINLRGVNSPRLKFSYHMIGSAVGNLSVQARVNNSGNWTTIFSRNGAQGTNWNQADISLASFAGQSSVQLRINAVSGNSWQGDIAIDALSISGSSNDPGGNCGQIDFSRTQITSFANQDSDGTSEVAGGGSGLILRNNTWKQIPLNYVITANTILQFDFQSTSQGEVHAVGFEDDNTLTADLYFKVHGTQNYGVTNFDNYSGSGTKRYTIPVGNFYSGDTDRLVLINDNDAGLGNNSLFSNIRIYERSCNGSLTAEEVIAQLENKESLIGNEGEGISTIKMTPNPTNDRFNLNVSANSTKEVMMSIYTILGQKKHEARLNSGVNNFSANNLSLSTGVYIVKIQSEGDNDVVKKLIVN